MIYYALLLLSIILTVCKSSLYNVYAQKSEPTIEATFRFNAVSYGVAAAIALIGMLARLGRISLVTVLCAFFYAAIVISLQTVSITAMRVGAMSTTAICVMYGMIIPSVAGPIFWREPIGILQIVGILMMIGSLWLLKGKAPKEEKRASKKWIVLAAVAFLCSGMAGVMEKIHQSTEAAAERLPFVFVACAFMFVFSVAASLITREKGAQGQKASTVSLAAVSGAVIGFYSTVNLVLAGKLDSMIYYPIANGGAMLLTVLVSAVAFKERFDRAKIAAAALGLLGILCLSIPV